MDLRTKEIAGFAARVAILRARQAELLEDSKLTTQLRDHLIAVAANAIRGSLEVDGVNLRKVGAAAAGRELARIRHRERKAKARCRVR